jgi:serine/threonine protein phosphatase 1
MGVTAAIGDVHGCIRTLDKLINEVEKRYSDVTYMSLGDVIDRGPGICDVMKLFMELDALGKLQMVRGNHEDVLIDFTEGTNDYNLRNWLTYGGSETLTCVSGLYCSPKDNPDIKDYAEFISPYYDFLRSAEFKIGMEFGDKKMMFSHAGIGPSRGLSHMVYEFQMRENYLFMWSRDTWRSSELYYGYTMVHGHTPVSEIEGHDDPHTPFVNYNKSGDLVSVAVDTGCVYGHSLSAMIIDDNGDFDFISERNCE